MPGASTTSCTRDLSFTYSPTGNRTQQQDQVSSQTINYTYDQANRLIDYNSVKQYRYNGDGLRLQKSTSLGWQNFTWDVGAGLPLLLQDAGGSYIYGPGGELVAQVAADGKSYYYHADQLGSVRALTDPNGTVVDSYQYDAYGNTTASSVTVGNPFGFAGEYTDAESGLVYLRARYYDPATQQFLTVDPLLAATEQAYNYAGGNPVNATDPSGQCGPACLVLIPIAADAATVGMAAVGVGFALMLMLNEQRNHTMEICATQVGNTMQQAWQAATSAQESTWQRGSPWTRLPRLPTGENPDPGKRYYRPGRNVHNPQDAWDREERGYRDADGNIWKPVKGTDPHAGEAWDVEHPDGTHTNVAPDGTVIDGKDNFPNIQR